jgi:hypothetical protein
VKRSDVLSDESQCEFCEPPNQRLFAVRKYTVSSQTSKRTKELNRPDADSPSSRQVAPYAIDPLKKSSRPTVLTERAGRITPGHLVGV